MASTRSTTPEDRFIALKVSSHNIQLKLEKYHEEVSRVSNDMAALTKVVAQLICNNNEVFDEALAKLCQTEYKLQRFRQPPQPSVEIEVQVPKDIASMFVQEELNVKPKQQADEKKVLLENEKKEDTKLDEVDKIDTITFSAVENKYASFATLISHIDFVIPEIFNNVVEHQNFLFVVLPKVIPNLKQASSAKIVILQHFKTRAQNRWWLGFVDSVGLGLCGGGCVVVAWVWVFGGFGSGSLWWWWLGFGSFRGFGSLWWWVRGGGLGLLIRWVWVFAVVGAWWWLGFGSLPWWVRGGGGLGLGIRWVWVFAVVGAWWWWLGFGYSVGLGLCRGGGLVDSVVGWVFAVVGWVFVVVGLGLCRGGGLVDSVVGWVFVVVGLGLCRGGGLVDSVVGLGLCGGGLGLCGGGFGSLPRPGVVESVAWGGCWVTGSGARPEGGGAVPFGG
uniref:Uncharacterized protein n=1 Tax=Fagus sylvatica TaxID=28930 RepID=A0A2N9IPF0_FAGSY